LQVQKAKVSFPTFVGKFVSSPALPKARLSTKETNKTILTNAGVGSYSSPASDDELGQKV